MARRPSSRKYQLTFNNPDTHGFSHGEIKKLLSEFSGLVYWCMCDEVGEEGTPHTHVFLIFKNAVMFDTMHRKFYGVHIEEAHGSNSENRDYVRKEGRWAESEKKETNNISTFEESGEMPPDRVAAKSTSQQILDMIVSGASNAEIIEAFPSAYTKINPIEQTRQTLLEEKYKNSNRFVEVVYLWGSPGVGKTRYVMDKYGYENVYRVTDYEHPFDGYKGQDVIVFEEFRSCIKIGDMLDYLDIYPLTLPCRYNNKIACFTKIFIISNIPLEQQYPEIQREQPRTWVAFLRRIRYIHEMTQNDSLEEISLDGDLPFES